MKAIIIRIVKCFFITLIILLAFLVSASAIPNRWLAAHQSDAYKTLEAEGDWPTHFFRSGPSKLDNYTDKTMVEQALNDEKDNVFEAAMHRTYSRYWHGYSIYLRPLLVLFSLSQIRYMLMLFFFLLFGVTAVQIARRIDIPSGVAFIVAVSMTYLIVVAVSLQFLPVFLISFIAILIGLHLPEKTTTIACEYFLIVGMVTSFIDLLTYPLVTLGLPLIVFILRYNNANKKRDYLDVIVSNSLFWGIGYGLTWASKWVIGSIVLKTNVFSEAAERIALRTMGNNELAGDSFTDRIQAIIINFRTMFMPEGKRTAIILALFLVYIIVLAIMYRTKTAYKKWQATALFVIGITPYCWYFALSNHSLVHPWFTFRAQTVTVFAILAGLARLIEWKTINHLRKKGKTQNG